MEIWLESKNCTSANEIDSLRQKLLHNCILCIDREKIRLSSNDCLILILD